MNAPLVQDQVALRVAGQTMRQNNDITYSNPALNPLGEDQLDQIRGKLLITPASMPGLRACSRSIARSTIRCRPR